MRLSAEYANPLPDPSRLGFAPLFESLPLVLAGAAAIFAIIILLYFLLRGRKQY